MLIISKYAAKYSLAFMNKKATGLILINSRAECLDLGHAPSHLISRIITA